MFFFSFLKLRKKKYKKINIKDEIQNSTEILSFANYCLSVRRFHQKGPILSQAGIKAVEFIKNYNLKTQNQKGEIIPVKIKLFTDNSYEMELLTPPISQLILKFISLREKNDNKKDNNTQWGLTTEEINTIYNIKKKEFNTKNKESGLKMILGTAKNIYSIKK